MKAVDISLRPVLLALLVLALCSVAAVPAVTVSAATPDWPLQLAGASTMYVTQAEFESLASAHPDSWSDNAAGNVWQGMALWRLLALVDDSDNTTFNDTLAAAGYDLEVIGADGYSYTFTSADVARNDAYILADELNGAPLPADKYPLKLVSSTFTAGGPSVAQVVCIKITGTTQPTHPVPSVADWPLELYGALSDNVTQAEFESAVSSYGLSYTDNSGTWTGIALWRLIALVDDGSPTTFNSASAAAGYSVWVAAPNYYYVFDSAAVAGNNDIIAANTLNGNPLPSTDPSNPSKLWYPVRLVGSGLHSGDRVGGVVMIELLNLPASPPSTQPAWDLNGDHVCNISDVVKIGLKWGQTGSASWIPEDLNNDGVINISDVVVVGLHWDQTW